MWVPQFVADELLVDLLRLADVGARGGWQRYWSAVSQFVQFIGFEPETKEYARLSSKAASNELFSDKALYSRNGTIPLYHTRHPATTPVYEPNHDLIRRLVPGDTFFDVVKIEHIDATTLDDALTDLGVKGLEFLKLDTQGAELDVLHGATKSLGGSLFGLEIEVEFQTLYLEQSLFPDIHRHLVHCGYTFVDFPHLSTIADYSFTRRGLRGYESALALLAAWAEKLAVPSGAWRGAKQILYADAIFFQDPARYLDASTDIIRRRVIVGVLICCVLGYYDYADALLRSAADRTIGDTQFVGELHRMVRRSSRSWAPVWSDVKSGGLRIVRRLRHPGR